MNTLLALLLLATRVIVGGPNADEMKDWPKPELKAGATDAEKLANIAKYGQTLYDTKHFSGVVLVAKNNEPVLTKSWGLADVATKTPNTLDTKFNIGSINKFFTKTAIAQLAESGKLSLDDTVRKHLPDYPSPVADKITIRQLIEHRSGLGDFFGERYDAAPPSKLREVSDFLPLFADRPLEFAPGTSQRYSNAGYIVLGLIIEKLSGEKYRDYVQRHIFDPAGMKGSGFWAVDETVANRATGYTLHDLDPVGGQAPSPVMNVRTDEARVPPQTQSQERQPNTRSLPGRPSSAGGAYCTAGDLLRFIKALEANKLASRKWTNRILSNHFEDPGPLGLGIGGGAPGLNTDVEIDGSWMVIAMSNFDPPSAIALGMGAMDIIHGDRALRENDHPRR